MGVFGLAHHLSLFYNYVFFYKKTFTISNFELKEFSIVSWLRVLSICFSRFLVKGCLDWDFFATFLGLFSDADAQVRKRRDSFASTQVIELCWVRRVDWATQTRLSEA